jgi:ketosteroid isomerase-like protein
MRRLWPIVLLVVVVLVGVAAFKDTRSARAAEADAHAQLLQADRDFDRATAEQGVEGWVSYFAEDGKMFLRNGQIVGDHDSIRELMAPAFEQPGYSLRWQPLAADMSSADDLGYTYGDYTLTATDKEGQPVTLYGRYVTIWKKQADGSWKVAADIGTPPNPSPPPPAE